MTGTSYVWVPVAATTTTPSKPVKPTSSSTTTTWSKPVKPTSTTFDCAKASYPGESGCGAAPTSSSTTTQTWSDYVDPTTTTTTTTATWSDYVDPTSTSTTTTWYDWTSTTTTTSSSSSKPTWTTSTTTTTSKGPAPTGAVCPADNGKTLAAGGSCGCSFAINCATKASPGAGSKFWQKTAGALVNTLAECNKQCDENSLCESTLW